MGLNHCFPVFAELSKCWFETAAWSVCRRDVPIRYSVWVPWLKSLDSGSVTLGKNYNAIWLIRWNHWFLNWGPGTHRGPWPIADRSANICYINLKKKSCCIIKKYRFGSFTSTKQEYSVSNPSHIIFKQVPKKNLVCLRGDNSICHEMSFLGVKWTIPAAVYLGLLAS